VGEEGIMIQLINPPDLGKPPNAAIEPPIWCAYLAASLREEGEDVTILDAQNLSVEETKKQMLTMDEGVTVAVAMGSNPSASSTPKMPVVEELKANCVAGLHPQALGRDNCIKFPKDLSHLTPAWDLIDLSKYKAHNWHCMGRDRGWYGVIYTSFGCPFNCYYCNIHSLYDGRKVALREPREIDKEIEYLSYRGIENLKICDELFTLYPKHVYEVCDILERYRNFNVWAYARVGTVNPYMLKRMKEVGINWLCYGFESADPSVRETVSKRYAHPEADVKATRDAGINVIANFIFGLPGDKPQMMQYTLDWAEEMNTLISMSDYPILEVRGIMI